MKIAYITYPCFLDSCIERIRHLSVKVDLFVYVVITPYSLKSTIYSSSVDYDEHKMLYNLDEAVNEKDVAKLYPYFKDCKSVKFVMMPTKSLR